ncbi:MAG: TIM barrel protein, partial [Verrucomicrobia bacterium]|nr:TIM barrel protein [Verrucomicrobiota bacterium]
MKSIFAALMISTALSASAMAQDIKLALQAYTFRDRSFVETVETAKRLGFKYIEAYPGQPLGDGFEGSTDYRRITPEALQQLKTYVDEQDVKIVHYGVTDADSDAQWDKLMAFAKVLGVGVIEIECSADRAKLDRAERAGERHKIKIGLHNHTQAEGLPEAVLEQLKGRGKYIGAGSDIGHWMSANTRPLDGVRVLKGKFVDMHITDSDAITSAPTRRVPLGSGAGEIAAVLDELTAQKYKGYVTLEYEHMSPALETEVAACVRWFNAYQAGQLDKDGKLSLANITTLWAGIAKTGSPANWDFSDGRKKTELDK